MPRLLPHPLPHTDFCGQHSTGESCACTAFALITSQELGSALGSDVELQLGGACNISGYLGRLSINS